MEVAKEEAIATICTSNHFPKASRRNYLLKCTFSIPNIIRRKDKRKAVMMIGDRPRDSDRREKIELLNLKKIDRVLAQGTRRSIKIKTKRRKRKDLNQNLQEAQTKKNNSKNEKLNEIKIFY